MQTEGRGEKGGHAAELFSNNLLIAPRGKFYSFNFALTTLLLLVFLFFSVSFLSVLYGRLCKAATVSCNEVRKRRIEVIAITILDIIHRPVFYIKRNVSETRFCLRIQVVHIQLNPIDKAS
jgi:hypothetical protein